MATLESRVDRSSDEFATNQRYFDQLLAELRERTETVRRGGGAATVERHRARGKLLPRERITRLCDPETPFLELSTLAE
jgi:3-methylcrotonyl-CoA carboxylase beta subunit